MFCWWGVDVVVAVVVAIVLLLLCYCCCYCYFDVVVLWSSCFIFVVIVAVFTGIISVCCVSDLSQRQLVEAFRSCSMTPKDENQYLKPMFRSMLRH